LGLEAQRRRLRRGAVKGGQEGFKLARGRFEEKKGPALYVDQLLDAVDDDAHDVFHIDRGGGRQGEVVDRLEFPHFLNQAGVGLRELLNGCGHFAFQTLVEALELRDQVAVSNGERHLFRERGQRLNGRRRQTFGGAGQERDDAVRAAVRYQRHEQGGADLLPVNQLF